MISMIAPGTGPGQALLVGSLLASILLTALAIRYAAHRRMFDLPGQRRSHSVPTPRGGGIAPVLVVLAAGGWLLAQDGPAIPGLPACLCGFGLIAGIGWIDDHRPLPASWRLVVHVAAAVLASLSLCGVPHTISEFARIAIAIVAITSLVNVWNFMDGIDGIAISQAALVVMVILAGGWLTGGWSSLGWLALMAILGFMPFNLPRARIFLGDVGSGALGYLLAVLLLHAVIVGGMPWPLALLPISAFLIDAGMTLAQRVLRGSAWWRPHREHLYQWCVRSGSTHWQVTRSYAMWTAVASAVALIAGRLGFTVGLAVTSAVIVSAALLWVWLRNRLWMAARRRH